MIEDKLEKAVCGAPPPGPMTVDRDKWAAELNLSNFVNTYYQFRDLQFCGNPRKILIIGPGPGFDALVLRWRGYEVTTFDIDPTFKPDYVGSVHDLSMFGEGDFDVVIASHVLEHLAEPYLDAALEELARVAHWALVYLPVHGRHAQLRFIPAIRNLDWSLVLDLFNFFVKPDGLTARYAENQHFWELGMRGFRTKDVIRRMSRFFRVIAHYRNKDWLPSHNFVLKSKRFEARPEALPGSESSGS